MLIQTPPPPAPSSVFENEDLLTSILCRLPTKSAVRFKCVSKHWLSLISGPTFSLLHVIHSPAPPPSGILFPHPDKDSRFHFLSLHKDISISAPFTWLNFTTDPSGEDIEILQSCNGLLLCSTQAPWIDGVESRVFYVFNPTTKRFSVVPPFPDLTTGTLSLSIFTRISLAFDPSSSPYYKVLLVRKSDGTRPTTFCFDVYCSKTRKWRRCLDHVAWPGFEVFSEGVYWNGAVHWASKRDGSFCFDVDKERLSQLPDFIINNSCSTVRYLGESGGHLYLVDARGWEFDVFEMERDYSNWVHKFCVDLARTNHIFPQRPCCGNFLPNVSVVSLVRQGCGGDLCLVLHVPGKILSYSLKSEGVEVIRDHFPGSIKKTIPALVRGFGGYQHFSSLACV